MEMVQIDDIKVMGANIVCMIMVQFQNLNDALQAILIIATITYTIARTVNEIKKIRRNGKTNSSTIQEDSQSE
jgi:hypothetical protein